jgi:hypothetical protein
MENYLIGALIFLAGFSTCYFSVKKPYKPKATESYTEVKRVRPSMRNPLRTYDIRYDKYKTKNTDLYQPVKPVRKSGVNEVEIDEEG